MEWKVVSGTEDWPWRNLNYIILPSRRLCSITVYMLLDKLLRSVDNQSTSTISQLSLTMCSWARDREPSHSHTFLDRGGIKQLLQKSLTHPLPQHQVQDSASKQKGTPYPSVKLGCLRLARLNPVHSQESQSIHIIKFYCLCFQRKAFAKHHQGEGESLVPTSGHNTHIALQCGITKLCRWLSGSRNRVLQGKEYEALALFFL